MQIISAVMDNSSTNSSSESLVADQTSNMKTKYFSVSGGGGKKKGNMAVVIRTSSLLVMAVVMAITLSSMVSPINANPTCILNCAQCVKIYGEFFDGHSCAKVCMDSRTRFDSFVDCADPTTIARFLKSY